MAYHSKYTIENFNNAVFVIDNIWVQLSITGLDISTRVTVVYNNIVLNGVASGSGAAVFKIPTFGNWTITGVVDGNIISTTQQIDRPKIYTVDMSAVNS